ncbi:MAG: hypothetical protein JSW15_03620, partial [Deltaproteobacteria bacterium]
MDFGSFVEGPLLWIVFGIGITGIITRVILFVLAIIKKRKDSYSRWNYSVSSFARAMAPFHAGFTKRPVYATLRYIFHGFLVAVPIWTAGHIALWEASRFGWSWAALPDIWIDWMTLIVLIFILFLLIRRIAVKGIRLNSSSSDYLVLIITALPFMSGYFLTHRSLDSFAFLADNVRLMHVLSAEAMILMVVVLFYRTRLNKATCT